MDKNSDSFNSWNIQKQKIHDSDRKLFFYEREVWWTQVGSNIGMEIDGKSELFLRPVIIVRKFNENIALAVPTTTTNKLNKYYFDTKDDEDNSYRACLSQIKVISSKRLLRKAGRIKKDYFSELINRITKMVSGNL